MFIAHIGMGLAAKRVAPKVPLGVLLVGGEALDVLCGVLMVAGVERMRAAPGATAMTPLEFIYYPWSHGLFMSVVWSVLAALIAARAFRDRRSGVVLGLLVFSHWILDWISHQPDLPLLWDGSFKAGLGLWNSVAGTMIAEFGIFLGGLALYVYTTTARDKTGIWSLAVLAILFVGLFLLNHYGPPPPVDISSRLLALPILIMAVLWPWGNWIERHRGAVT